MKYEDILTALQSNLEAHNRGATPIHSWELCSILNDIGPRWRVAWEMMPRDQIFDALYAFRPPSMKDEEPEDMRPFLFRQDPANSSTHAVIAWDEAQPEPAWMPNEGPQGIVDWLNEHPPFPEMEPIAELYQYSNGITPTKSPWVLMMALLGVRSMAKINKSVYIDDFHVGGVDLFEALPLADNDTLPFAQALRAWALSIEVAQNYVHLIDAYDSHLS